MSDLRERLADAIATEMRVSTAPASLEDHAYRIAGSILPIIEAELQKRDQEIERLKHVEYISLWALDGVSSYLQSGAQQELVKSTRAYVDQTRNEIRGKQQAIMDDFREAINRGKPR